MFLGNYHASLNFRHHIREKIQVGYVFGYFASVSAVLRFNMTFFLVSVLHLMKATSSFLTLIEVDVPNYIHECLIL